MANQTSLHAESQEQLTFEPVPVKMYQADERLTVAAPMPGLEPQDIEVEVTSEGRLILDGRLRGFLKGVKKLLLDEWTVGGYHRELALPQPVDGSLATVTYGNGVLVVTLPLGQQTRPAKLTLETVAPNTGQRVGSAGHPPHPVSTSEHAKAIGRELGQQGGPLGHEIYGMDYGAEPSGN
jgi:HSP20 family protein